MHRLAALLLLASTSPVAAQTSSDAAAFGARETVQDMAVAPDGGKIAIIVPRGRGATLAIADLARGGAPKGILSTDGDPDTLRSCEWVTATRLICTVTVTDTVRSLPITFSRLIALNADGSELKMLSARGSVRALGIMQDGGTLIDFGSDTDAGTVLVTRQFVPEEQTGSILAASRAGLGVEQIDTLTLKRRTVEPPRNGAVEYISDGYGHVRIMGVRPETATGMTGTRIAYFYRTKGDRSWRPFGDLVISAQTIVSGFNPVAVDPTLDVVYGFEKLNGRQALYRVALDGTRKKELVLARPDVDVDGLIRIGRHDRVVGASYAADRRVAEYFDPSLAALRTSLSRAVKGQSVTVTDATVDEKAMIVFTGSDRDPGRYYRYDTATRQLGEILPVRPQLTGRTLAAVQPVTYPAADGTKIPGYLTLPPGKTSLAGLPAIVLPHGGPGARDEWGFDWLSQFYAARGFAVLQPNFRGSTGYGDAWFQKNGFQSWRTAVGDVNDGGRWLVAQGADARHLAIVGWSYGGYAALQSSVLDPKLFKAIVAIAPVTDLDALREEAKPYASFNLVDAFIGHGAHVREGSPARNVAAITAPVMLVHGTRDRNVGVGESRLMADRLRDAGRPATYIEFDGLDHYLDDPVARERMLRESDAFLRKSMGMSAG